jgi:hypothetical protein
VWRPARAAVRARRLLGLSVGGLIALTILAPSAMASVSTDQTDYAPGSVATISGDNSDNAGYLAGETVNVGVTGPGGYLASCSATADGNGAWSCQVTLGSGTSAIGQYSYTAVGQASGVSQSGQFTDSQCTAATNGNKVPDPYVTASYTTSGNTATYTIASASGSSAGGVPGLIEYCVFTSPLPTSEAASYPNWTTAADSGAGFFDFERTGGDPNNIPLDGSAHTVGTATWSTSVPTAQTIYLHINDPNECAALYGAGTLTCFVLPGTAQDLTVKKTATPSFTRTYTWGISKSVDKTQANIASGGSATFNYTVGVTHDNGTDGHWQVSGKITVSNPNSFGVSGVNVGDTIDNGGTCSVTGGNNQTIAANSSSNFDYSCTFTSNPGSGTNTATASWPSFGSPDASASGTAPYDFGSVSPTIVDGSVSVTDTLGGTLGSASYMDTSPKSFTYSHTFSRDVAGTCTAHPNVAMFTTDTTQTTGSSSQSVTVCVGADLGVAKTASAAFNRTYAWNISKSVDHTSSTIPSGGSATFNYTVNVTHDNGTDSGWTVTGQITVTNPNDWEAVTANVTDAINNGGSCTVANGTNVSVPKSGSVTLNYACTYASAPSPSNGTNIATATWDASASSTPDSTASGNASIDFGTTAPTIRDGSVTVIDTVAGSLGTVKYTDPSPTTFTYSHTFSGDVAGTCTTHPNTATFTTNTTSTTGSANQSVTVCVGADLKVSKNAAPTFTRTYGWTITKTVDGKHPSVSYNQTGSARTLTYAVTVTKSSGTDSAWGLTGAITVTNPNDWEDITGATVTDAVDNGGSCSVTNGTNVTVPKTGSVSLNYTCTWSSPPTKTSGTNTATVTWSAGTFFTPHGSATGTATFAFATPTTVVHDSVKLSDAYTTSPSPLPTGFSAALSSAASTFPSGTISTTTTFTYTYLVTVPHNCLTLNNTAKFTSTDSPAISGSDAVSGTVCRVPATTGALTMGFWQNKNGQAIITGGATTGGVCNSGTWLRQYAPFQDLSSTANCSAVATYVYNIIKAANASGSSMNAMLKAQMLATALDVYFSDSALGGNKIGAPAPVGSVSIDLTVVPGMIDSSSGTGTPSGSFENASSAFGGATSLTISQMLIYAASQSNAGGGTWYGNVKATQQLAKDAFDAINNGVAYSSV